MLLIFHLLLGPIICLRPGIHWISLLFDYHFGVASGKRPPGSHQQEVGGVGWGEEDSVTSILSLLSLG